MPKPRLEFLKNDAGEREGLGDAGIETFRDDPSASCGRESGQNSLDAAAEWPVRMTFDLLSVREDDLPFHGELLATVERCLDEAKKKTDSEKELDFFRNAKKLLTQPSLKVLRISDYSTKGLVGPPDVPDTPFDALLKGSGVSNKISETSGGSFGIGKNASFAVSDLQAVLYSTVYKSDDGGEHFAAQGKVRLVSHTAADGNARRATGYWGNNPGYKAITDPALVPEWMRRTEVGTSIFCLGFRAEEHWAERIAYSLILNFFVAIHRGQIVFEINDGALKINQNTLAPLFHDEAIRSAANDAGRLDDLDFSAALYECLLSPDTTKTTMKVQDLGSLDLRVLVRESLPKRVGIVRNGMLITTSLENFGDRLERFKGSKEFVALLEPTEAEASKLMKRLENPKHDSFSAQRLLDEAKRKRAEQAMKALIRDLREFIRDQTVLPPEEELSIDELTEIFAAPPSEETPPGGEVREDPETFVYTVPKREKRQKKPPVVPKVESEGEGGRQEGTNNGKGGVRTDGSGHGDGAGGRGRKVHGQRVPLRDVRNLISKEGARHRTLWFTPGSTGPAEIEIEAPGVNSPEQLRIVSTTEGKVTSGGRLALELSEGARLRVDVVFDSDYAGPIEASATAVELEAVQ